MGEIVEVKKDEGLDAETFQALVMSGDMAKLKPGQRIAYYKARCEAAGLDPRTAPFQYMTLQGKMTLYATKGATDQLARNHKIRLQVLSQETAGDIRIVMVRATAGDGRETDEMGAVPVGGLRGADLANAYMKAITKAKRRAVLSLCGLGMLDETEIETVHGVNRNTGEILMPQPLPATAVAPAETEPAEEVEDAQEQSDDDTRVAAVSFTKIIASSDDRSPTGKVYHAYPSDASIGILSTNDRALALKIKEAVGKKAVRVTITGGTIIGVEDVPVA